MYVCVCVCGCKGKGVNYLPPYNNVRKGHYLFSSVFSRILISKSYTLPVTTLYITWPPGSAHVGINIQWQTTNNTHKLTLKHIKYSLTSSCYSDQGRCWKVVNSHLWPRPLGIHKCSKFQTADPEKSAIFCLLRSAVKCRVISGVNEWGRVSLFTRRSTQTANRGTQTLHGIMMRPWACLMRWFCIQKIRRSECVC